MEENSELRQRLLQRVEAKRTKISAFAGDLEKRGDRLTNLSIICTSITAVFTAGPALGGESFAEGAQKLLGLSNMAAVWRPICLLAVVLSVLAAVANNLYKSQEIAPRIARAQACDALLDGLEAKIEFGQLALDEAAKQYQQYISSIPFIPDESGAQQAAA